MTNFPNRDDREDLLWPREPWKICSKSGFSAAAEISIIKIGLVYVIMIVITLVAPPAAANTAQTTTHGSGFSGFQKRLLLFCLFFVQKGVIDSPHMDGVFDRASHRCCLFVFQLGCKSSRAMPALPFTDY